MALKPQVKSGLMNQPFKATEPKPKLSDSEAKALIERMRAYDSEMVTGIFENREAPGQGTRFSIHLYPGDDFDVYEFFDGERYRIPRGVARHINNGCAYKEYAQLKANVEAVPAGNQVASASPISDGRYQGGNNHMQAVKMTHRYSFKSLEFSDDHLDTFQSNVFLPDKSQIMPNIL